MRRDTGSSSAIRTRIGSKKDYSLFVSMLAAREIAVADLTTVISPLTDALTAFDALRAGRVMKALISPGNQA